MGSKVLPLELDVVAFTRIGFEQKPLAKLKNI
jgi:hypothetical protein